MGIQYNNWVLLLPTNAFKGSRASFRVNLCPQFLTTLNADCRSGCGRVACIFSVYYGRVLTCSACPGNFWSEERGTEQ
jgi:hypothetical protein